MTQRLTIGVVLCTYNGERYLRAQVESIFRQHRKPDLLLAYDDGSSDGTMALLEELAGVAPFRFVVRRNPGNLGYVRNFEQAIRDCDADIILLSDQDDDWKPEKVSALEAVFAYDATATAAFSDADIVDEELHPLGSTLLDAVGLAKADREAVVAGKTLPLLLRRNFACGAALGLRASSREWVLPFPEGAIHDEWIALVNAARGGLRFIPDALIRYRQHTANQIGLRSSSWRTRLDTFLHRHGPETERRLRLMHQLKKRLLNTGATHAVLEDIEGAIAHLQHRVSLHGVFLRRTKQVFSELKSGRYARYSFGWASAGRDLLLPMQHQNN